MSPIDELGTIRFLLFWGLDWLHFLWHKFYGWLKLGLLMNRNCYGTIGTDFYIKDAFGTA